MPVGTMTSKGQITVPKEIREAVGLEPGDRLLFDLDGEEIRVRREPDLADLVGSVPVPEHLRGRPWKEIRAIAREEWVRQATARGWPDAD